MAARARTLTETDEAEWAQYAQRIAPLPGRGPGKVNVSTVVSEPPAEVPSASARDVTRRGPRPVEAVAIRPPLGVGGQPAGIDTSSWQRFRRGQLVSERKLDLHGMTAQQAFHALRLFLRTAHADRVRCVEIVTGRGDGEHGGVLRREFALWLNLPDVRPLVLAAVHPHTSSAMHSHMANPGSVRLLLRRPRA
jgi:DNA-nicking Smr family endonuclease